jgi:DeoR/GlpR family transcriptional regulator of sugar metabolism
VATVLDVSNDDDLGLTNGECELTIYANKLRTVEPFAVGLDCTIKMLTPGNVRAATGSLLDKLTAGELSQLQAVAAVSTI